MSQQDDGPKGPGLNIVRKVVPTRLIARVSAVSWRDALVTIGPLAIVCLLAIGLTVWLLNPAPPSVITISGGPEGSSLQRNAEKYQKILARSGVKLIILPSRGSLENLQRLRDPKVHVDVAFVVGGLAEGATDVHLMSLGSVAHQSLFVFYRNNEKIANLAGLAGKRISIGPEGSAGHELALNLLKANGIEPDHRTQIFAMEGEAPHKALLDGRVDAVFLMGDSAPANVIRELLDAPGVRLLNFDDADAYTRHYAYLSKIHLPRGVLDLARTIPQTDVDLIAPTVELVARDTLHPALSDLLIETAKEVHGKGGILTQPGEFPAPVAHEFKLSDDAARYYRSGKSALYRNLPFWVASLIDRILIVIVPIVVLLVPSLRFVPWMYNWRIRSRIYKWYGALIALERSVMSDPTPEAIGELRTRLDEIEHAVNELNVPLAFVDQLYVLRQHIGFVRERVGIA
jgi:TRAP-type uncharacterized transport system substrate-binding protein